MDILAEIADQNLIDPQISENWGFGMFLLHFFINFIVVGFIIQFLYYPKSRRRDYYFTFTLIAVSIFLMIFLLNSVKIKVGFALGLFAIFGIIRYRTESVPIREMTYLFAIIALSVINALAMDTSYIVLGMTNLIFIITIWALESNRWLKHISSKLIIYDKINLITPDKENELIADLKRRTGLEIIKIEVGHIDFLRDTAMLKIYYKPSGNEINTVDNMTKLPREE